MAFRKLIFLVLLIDFLSANAQVKDYYLKARAFDQLKNPDSALFYYSKYIEEKQQDYNAFLNRGILLYTQNKINAAIDDFNKAEKLKKDVASFYLARCYARLKDTLNSIAFIERHLNSSNKMPASIIRMEPAFVFLEQTDSWKKLLQKNWYTRLDEQRGEAEFILNSGDNLGLINFVNDLSKEGKLRSDLLFLRAKAYFNLGQLDMALNDLNTLLENSKHNYLYYSLRSDVYISQKNFKKALQDLNKSIDIQEDAFELYLKRAFCLGETDQPELGIEDANLYLSLFPGNREALLLSVKLQIKTNQHINALLGINQLIATDSLNPKYFLVRAGIYEKTGIIIQARKDYNNTLKLAPNNIEALLARGKFLYSINEIKSGCVDWKKAEKAGNLEAGRLFFENCTAR